MKKMVKNFILKIIPLVDICIIPFVYVSAWLLKLIRVVGIRRFPVSKKILFHVGVFPISNHYYEPQFDMRNIKSSFPKKRILPGIDWNMNEQLSLLNDFTFSRELDKLPMKRTNDITFHLNNQSFESGDAEYWYQLIRIKKPKKIFEIGSGNSTLMAIKAIDKNMEEDSTYKCKHICIEPYEMPWLEKTSVGLVRKKVEDIEVSYFLELEENDILFIDSSHIIRPDGDVLFEYLELLPILNKGVIVHIHDIFSPRNYLETWLNTEVRFWNEQYILEAFLSHNSEWKIIGALNYLKHDYYKDLKNICPYLTEDREPGSFYIQKKL